jgi:hypothetical protein
MSGPAQNPNDGTQLGTSEVISDEFVDPSMGCRKEPLLPVTGYKLPRSKIVVGVYGQDWGDASFDFPLAAESRTQRQAAEIGRMVMGDETLIGMCKLTSESVTLGDSRGGHIFTRGTR